MVYNNSIELDPNKHMVFNYFDLLKPLGIKYPKKIELVKLPYKNIKKENIVGVHPCNTLLCKVWPQERWIEVIEYLALKNKVLILGSKEEAQMVKELLKKVKTKRIKNLSGKLDIKQLINIISKLKLFIASDGGPIHIASTVNTPVISLFGPETPIRYKPFSKNSISLYNPTKCSPCIASYANRLINCKDPVCLKNISTEDVIKAIEKLTLKNAI